MGDPNNGTMILKWGVDTPLLTMLVIWKLKAKSSFPRFSLEFSLILMGHSMKSETKLVKRKANQTISYLVSMERLFYPLSEFL